MMRLLRTCWDLLWPIAAVWFAVLLFSVFGITAATLLAHLLESL